MLKLATINVLSLLFATAGPAEAQSLKSFCAAASKIIGEDNQLREASEIAFGEISYAARNDECVYPFRVLHYSTADVLLTEGSAPGSLTHAETAGISAFFIAHHNGQPKLVNKAIDFTTTGGFGEPGKIVEVTVGGDDGFTMSGGWAGGGYESEGLAFYVFKGGHVVALTAVPELNLSASNEGLGTGVPTVIKGTWHLARPQGAELTIDYDVHIGKRRSNLSATWHLQGDHWILTSGQVPPQMKQASGG